MRLIIFIGLLSVTCGEGAKILGIFAHPGKSHFDVFEALFKQLAKRGHDVTVASFYPQNKPIANYTDISFVGLMPQFVNVINFTDFEEWIDYLDIATPFVNLIELEHMGYNACRTLLPSDQIQNLLKSNQKFDLVITEIFNTDCFLGLVHKLQAPFIVMSSCYSMPWFNNRFGNPSNPSYIPNMYSSTTDQMTFLQRLYSAFWDVLATQYYEYFFVKGAQELAEKYIGNDIPPLEEIAKNSSLMLINTHFTLHRPKPTVPAIIEIGGIHIQPAKKLPEDIEKFINESTHGVILFSLGSMLKAETLGEANRKAFIDALKEIPQRVIWKFEKDLPGLPENIKIYPWLPQRDILAHKNVKAFIAHGGLLGLTEAIHEGKPVLGIPMYGDQHLNLRLAALDGYAVELPFNKISKETVASGIKKILSKEFYENAQRIKNEFRDRPLSPMETAVYWTEYVIRHKGAKRLKTAAVDLPAYQYYLIDVSITFLIIFAFIISIIYFSFKILIKLILRLFNPHKKLKTN